MTLGAVRGKLRFVLGSVLKVCVDNEIHDEWKGSHQAEEVGST